MIKICLLLSMVLLLFLSLTKISLASDNSCRQTADYSACIDYNTKNIIPDIRKLKLENYLKYKNSQLHLYSDYLIDMADHNQLLWTLLPAIAGVESNFCQQLLSDSYNCWGWANGKFKFKNFYEAIDNISTALKTKYIDRGLTTPERIGRVYAPPSAAWAVNVRFFMNKIENVSVQNPSALQITL